MKTIDDLVFTYELGKEDGHIIYGNVGEITILPDTEQADNITSQDTKLYLDADLSLYTDSKTYEIPQEKEKKYLDILQEKFKNEISNVFNELVEEYADASHSGIVNP